MAHRNPRKKTPVARGIEPVQRRSSPGVAGKRLSDESIRERRREALQEQFGRDIPESCTIRVGARGRLVIPAKVRNGMRLRAGDDLVLVPQPDGSCSLIPRRTAVRNAFGVYSHLAPGRSLVQELIDERRREAARDARP